MEQDLTKRYSSLFERKGLSRLLQFFHEVYLSGKLSEICSFIIWEFLHRSGLFPNGDYIRFNPGEAIRLQNQEPATADFAEKLYRSCAEQDLNLTLMDRNWKFLYINENGEMFGCIYPEDSNLYKSVDCGQSIVLLEHFPEKIKSLFISSQDTIYVCIKGSVYSSRDQGCSFVKTLALGSSESFFRSMYAMTETPDRNLIIGEYGNIWDENGWRNLANLYSSSDNGQTWKCSDFLKKKGINKHVHIIRYSKLLNRLLLTDGDNQKKLWLSDPIDTFDFEHPHWKPANRFHIQTGGYTSVVESDGKIFFGTDYQGGTNFVVETTDGENFTKRILPDPYRRSPVMQLVQRKSKRGNEVWASLPFSTAGTKCLVMYTVDGGRSWNKFMEYTNPTHSVSFISSSQEIVDELYLSIANNITNDRVVYRIADAPTR